MLMTKPKRTRRGRKLPYKTHAYPWWSPCHGRPALLCVRGKFGMTLIFVGVRCSYPGCETTYKVELDTTDRSDWKKVPDVCAHRDQVHVWVIPPEPPGGYGDENGEDGGE